MSEQKVTKLEVELLLIFYNFSDQYGKVDTPKAKKWAFEKLGIIIPDRPFTLEQKHIDILMDSGAVPDTRLLLDYVLKTLPSADPKPKRRSPPRAQS